MKKASGQKLSPKSNKVSEVKKRLLEPSSKKSTKKVNKNNSASQENPPAQPVFQQAITHNHAETPKQEISFIPDRYNEDLLVLMVKDPWWIFAYWDYTQGNMEGALNRVRSAGERPQKMTLRVYEVTCRSIENSAPFFDVEIESHIRSWYVDVGKPGESWQLEIGFRTASGNFYSFLRSNLSATPPVGLSDCTDETWMLPEESYRKLIELSFDPRAMSLNSLKVREYYERYAKSISSSRGGR